MLSVENPPRDPPCPCEISQVESGSDERASAKLEAENVDLLNSAAALVDDNIYQLPKFSIRDYVFSTRSKDITNNWPFSQEKLQICLKHGMTEVLPPFQPLDALREDPSQVKCNATLVDPGKSSNSDGKLYRPSDEFVFVDSDDGCDERKLVVSGSQGDKETQSCSDADSASLVPTKKTPPPPPPLASEGNNSHNTSQEQQFIAKSAAFIPPPLKSKSKSKSSSKPEAVVKKCKFIVKLNHLGDTAGAKEDAAMNNNNNSNYMVSEAMASKVCPVCRTFSSSSNTTLNAHIDQCLCLSGDFATKWPGDSRVINKHRIKPRKKRSMGDIYETALHCTLEELDRRNGTNWASNSSTPPAQETQISAHKHDGGLNSDESPDQSAVYIDANGTKLRILSKFGDPSSDSKPSDDPRPRKLMKGGKFLLAKKKKKKNHLHLQKQQKLSKHEAPLGKKITASDHTSQVDEDQDRDFSCEKDCAEVDCIPLKPKALDQVKFNKLELIKGWVCSKRTGLTKKINGRDGQLHSAGGNANKEMQPESNQSSLSTSMKRSSAVKNRYDNSPSPSNSKRIDTSSHEAHSEYGDHPSPKKRSGFSVMEAHGFRNRKRSLILQEYPERSPKYLKHDGNRRSEVKAGTHRNVEHSVTISPKKSSSPQGILSRSKFSFLKKRALSADRRASASDSKFHSKWKCLAVKKSRMEYLSQTNRKVVVSPARMDRHFMPSPTKTQASVDEGTSSEESIERTRVIKVRDETISKEEVATLKNSQSPIARHHDVGENCGSLVLSSAFDCTSASDARESAGKGESAACGRGINIELPSEDNVGGIFTGLNKTLESRFDGIEDPRGMQHTEAYRGSLFESEAPTSSAEPILSGEQEMFCTDVGAENMMRKNGCQIVELDSSNGQGNYFGEVDSIPIPGPPGSFLPSPGRMDSEDIPGISSLSSSRIQSSDGHQELIYHSSESPISTTSTISNSTLGRSEVKSSSENVCGGSPLVVQLRSDISDVVTTNAVDPVVDNNFTPVRRASGAGGGLGEVKANVTLAEDGASLRYQNDQPCCCSRKEMLTQNVALNYQDSTLLRRRAMTAAVAAIPASGKQQMNGDHLGRSLDNGRTVIERSLIPEEGRSSMGGISYQASSVPVHGNYESVSPATPNPVLRLMGKNLMVVNKEENLSPQLRTSQPSCTMNMHENMKAVPVPVPIPIPVVSSGRSQDEEHRMVCQGPILFDGSKETRGFMQHPDMRWSSGYGRSHGILVRADDQMASVESPGMVCGRSSTGRGLRGSLGMHQEYSTGGYHTPIELVQPMNQYRPRIPVNYNMEKDGTENLILHSWKRRRSSESPENRIKEIIVIDDAAGAATCTTTTTATATAATATETVGRHRQQWREDSELAASSRRRGLGCDTWSLNPFYTREGYEYEYEYEYEGMGGNGGGVGRGVNASSRVVASNKGGGNGNGNGNGMRWNCNPEVGHESSLGGAASSSSPGRLRSELYNASGF